MAAITYGTVSNLITTIPSTGNEGHHASAHQSGFVVRQCPHSNSVSHRGVHSHESQELSCWSPGRWLLRCNVHAHDESWERASGPKSREGHDDVEGGDGEIGRSQGRGNRSDSRQDDPRVVFWLNQGEQRLHDCRQGQG